jgi:dynein heavy chain
VLYFKKNKPEYPYRFIRRMVVNNLRNFNDLLLGKVSLFQVETSLAVPEVVLLPAANDIYNSILRSIREFLEK